MKKIPKVILDACCGGKMFWFEKNHPNVLYVDNRRESNNLIKNRPEFSIEPDMIVDFRKMPFYDKSFKLVVFDPPHLTSLGKNSWMSKKYGILDLYTWREDIRKGFDECWRVLDNYGVLIFKWNESEVKTKDVLKVISQKPMFGHISGKQSKTIWMCFMKLPIK